MAKRKDSPGNRKNIFLVGLATFFFGFGAGALYNWYLITVHDPLVTQFRASLSYKSAILGDGILLPLVNMQMFAFIVSHKRYLGTRWKAFGVFGATSITVYFHIKQALDGVVNWAMPTPWHWNLLGLWHACYMFAVSFLISVFLWVCFHFMRKERKVPIEFVVVCGGILLFLLLLRLDYIKIKLF